ncbi:Annexin_2 [Hexamita inflata]|uniref:Annexin 2 n=1 Tax=Hexamita inflata TaxID=28002 RepID=A0AA86NUP2_9EUKA|nr:Annexin 2 [Hexamita inflata]
MQSQLEFINEYIPSIFNENKCSIPNKALFQTSDYMKFAQEIYDSCQFDSFDEQRFLNVLLQCTVEDMCKVNHAFLACYGCSISSCITKDCNTNFEKVILGSVQNRYTFWATQIHDTLYQSRVDTHSLGDLIVMADTLDMQAINSEYKNLYSKEVHTDIYDSISKDSCCARFLRAWCNQERSPRNSYDFDAESLHKALNDSYIHEDVLITMFCTTTPCEFRDICEFYQRKYGKTLRETLTHQFSSMTENVCLLAHDYLMDPSNGCAYVIFHSLKCEYNKSRRMINLTVLFRDRYSQFTNRWYQIYGNLKHDLRIHGDGWNENVLSQLWNSQ